MLRTASIAAALQLAHVATAGTGSAGCADQHSEHGPQWLSSIGPNGGEGGHPAPPYKQDPGALPAGTAKILLASNPAAPTSLGNTIAVHVAGTCKSHVVQRVPVLKTDDEPAAQRQATPLVVIPPWNHSMLANSKQFCFSAPMPPPPPPTPGHTPHHQYVNDRLVWLALPDGTPPQGGWPVWVSLVTDSFSADPRYGSAAGVVCPPQLAIDIAGGQSQGRFSPDKGFWPFSLPAMANVSVAKPVWNYDQEAGAMWDQRLKQHMLARPFPCTRVPVGTLLYGERGCEAGTRVRASRYGMR